MLTAICNCVNIVISFFFEEISLKETSRNQIGLIIQNSLFQSKSLIINAFTYLVT
jgi:hypothetical protein